MPYASKKQAAFIHARADAGEKWAKKFVRDAHGTHVRKKSGIREGDGIDHKSTRKLEKNARRMMD